MFAFCGKVIFAKFAFIANSKQLFIGETTILVEILQFE